MSNEIVMVDLLGQYNRIKPDIDTAIQDVIASTHFIKGPVVHSFENELAHFLGVKHVISCGNGTDALQIALMALELKPGDEVITSSFSFIATAEVIALLGLTPVFVDVDPRTFCIDIEQVASSITPQTKAIIPVHLFGQCANMQALIQLVNEQNQQIAIVEDTAQALGAQCIVNGKWNFAGTIGDLGCCSFFPSKNLGAFGDGGAIFTNNDTLAKRARTIANHGSQVKYFHQIVGLNSRLDSIQAAVLRVKLKHLDSYNKARQSSAAYYDEALSGIHGVLIPKLADNSTHIYHQYTLCVLNNKRDELRDFLASNNIPSMVYYPVPLHLQEAFIGSSQVFKLSVSEQLASQVLSLPMHTELNETQLAIIVKTIKNFFST